MSPGFKAWSGFIDKKQECDFSYWSFYTQMGFIQWQYNYSEAENVLRSL